MKYLVMLCDGMADEPNEALGGVTPMEKADKPCMDSLAAKAEVGMVNRFQQVHLPNFPHHYVGSSLISTP